MKLFITIIAFLALTACGAAGTSSTSSSTSSSSTSSSSSSSSSSSTSSSSSSSGKVTTVTLQESDKATCSYSGVIETEHAGYTGSGFINTENAVGASIVWAINAAEAGNYSVNTRYANGSEASRGGNLSVDESGFSTVLLLDLTSAWTDWQTAQTSISLVAGNNIVHLTASTTNGIANFDSITFEGEGLAAGDCSNATNTASGVYPAVNSIGINPDTYLRIKFDNTPSIANGYVDIFDAATNQRVDRVNVQADKETTKAGSRLRRDGADLVTTLVQVVDNAIIVNPHSEKFNYNKTYYINISNGVFKGQINGQSYSGVSGQEWKFTTKSSGPSGSTVTVDDDGIADFSSVQGAFNYIMKNYSGSTNAQVNIKNGVYLGLLELKGKSNLRVVGESRDNTIILARNGNNLNPGDDTRSLLTISNADLNSFENLSLRNNIPRDVGGQAEVLYYNSGGRITFKNVALFSEQDTILVKGSGYSWFYNSLVAGNVDFIWGSPKAALFENSEIRSLGDSAAPSSDQGGYVVQSRAPTDGIGFVFLNTRFTRGIGPAGNSPGNGKTALGRGADKTDSYDSVAFINCEMDSHIRSQGFDTGRQLNPSNGSALKGYREYGSKTLSGNTISLSTRWSAYILNNSDVNQYYRDRATIFAAGGTDWNPVP